MPGFFRGQVAETQHALPEQRETPSTVVLAMLLSFLDSPKHDLLDPNGNGSILSALGRTTFGRHTRPA
jgi:hypothetical protein